jgi:diguanylate cyclase (GGDEF)-like protein
MEANLESSFSTADQVERLYAIAPVGLGYLDTEFRICHINEMLASIYGFSGEEGRVQALGKSVAEIVDGIIPQLQLVLETGMPVRDWEMSIPDIEKAGQRQVCRFSLYPDRNSKGGIQGISCVANLIGEISLPAASISTIATQNNAANKKLIRIVSELRKKNSEILKEAQRLAEENKLLAKAKQRLARLALYDSLTGLGNRELFLRQVAHVIAIAERRNEEIAILEMDLDGFKAVNDKLGHAAGDEVLREFGERLSRALRKADQKFRIGGDEFAVLLEPQLGALDGAYEVAEQIAALLTAPMEIKGHSCSIGVSIGVAVFPDHGRIPEALLRKADAAMYEAKKKQQVVARASDLNATTVLKSLDQSTFQLIYVSTAVREMNDTDLVNLMLSARARNERNQVTGMLLYKDCRFMEVLEGEESTVRKIFADIEKDSRHKNIDTLRAEGITFRAFPNWTMGFQNSNPSESAAFTEFLIKDGTPDYFAEESIEAHAMLLAFKGVSLSKHIGQRNCLNSSDRYESAIPQS